MALNYLLCPTFQVINTGGKPATGGYIECYIHGTRDKYYCYSDWEGTLHPFQIPLDSLGANIVLADEQNSYDVYIYNRYGSLLMSRYKVKPSGGGGIASITSSDGSINVNYTENGIDLTLADDKASCLKAGAQNLSADGIFTWFKKESVGESIHCDQGFIVLDDGWYHFTATVRLDWRQIPVNETGRITLSTTLTSDVMEFDYSYAHDETFELSGDICIAPSSTQYIQSGRGFVLSVFGMKTGMVAEMVGLDIHTILGQGAAGGEKNVHRLLRYYTNASEADEQHPAGDWLHDLDSEDPDDPSRHPMVTADQLFAWYNAGQNFELYEVDGTNGQLGWSAVYRMVTWQDQSDWWSQFAPTPGKACRLEFFRMGMYSTPYRGGLIAYIRYKDEDYMRLYEIMPGQSIWMAEYQEKLPYYARDWHAGDFLRVKQDGSNLEWVPLSGVALSGSYNDLSDVPAHLVQDADYVHTDNNFTDNDKSKLDGIESGAEVNVQANWTEADSSSDSFIQNKPQNLVQDADYVHTDNNFTDSEKSKLGGIEAGAEVNVQSDWTEADSSDDAFIRNKPSTKRVYAGQNITITEDANGFTISAPNFVQEQADWNEADSSDPSFIKNKPSIPTATSDLTNDSGYITLSDVPARVNADWNSNSGASEILNKPDLSIYAETANLATVATTGDYSDLVNKPTIPAAQVNSDWNSNSGVSQILNKPNLSTVATTGDYDDLVNKPSIPAAQVNADWNSSSGVSEILNKPSLAAVATSGDYSDLSNTPSIPTATSDLTNDSGYITLSDVPAQVQSDWTEADNTDPAYIQNKPTLAAVATSGDYSDLSNTPSIPTATSDLTNDSGYITLSDVPAQVNADWNSSSGVSEILNKPNLATVATTGSYSDLSNTPSIPTATSDLTNDSGYITLSDVPAQVQSDWAESDTTDPAYIENKPTIKQVVAGSNITITESTNTFEIAMNTPIPSATSDLTNDSGFITLSDLPAEEVEVLTYGTSTISDYTAAVQAGKKLIVCKVRDPDDGWRYVMQSVSSPFPEWCYSVGAVTYQLRLNHNGVTGWDTLTTNATTSSDSGKVFTVDQYGRQVWAAAQGTTYSAGTGIDITSNTISVENPLPASTSAEAGKVLKVDSNGDPTWATGGGGGGGVNADWAESDPLEPSYIENKPTPKTLTAGTGISIADGVSSVTISSTVTVPVQDVTVDGTSVVSNGVAAITSPTVDQTYDATSANAQSGVAVASAISAAVIPISVVSTLPASPDPNTLYVVTGA